MEKINFRGLESIKENGFVGFVSFEKLFDSTVLPRDGGGVYMILRLSEDMPTFVEVGSGGVHKGKNPNVLIDELQANWVVGAKVVYIGKGNNVRKRLKQYQRFGKGQNVGHYGGRLIWQIKDAMNDLVVCWKKVDDEVDPEVYERELINEFINQNGAMPFANLR